MRLWKFFEESLADLYQISERHAAAKRGVGDDEKGEAAGRRMVRVLRGRLGDVVNLVRAMGVCELLWLVMFNLG